MKMQVVAFLVIVLIFLQGTMAAPWGYTDEGGYSSTMSTIWSFLDFVRSLGTSSIGAGGNNNAISAGLGGNHMNIGGGIADSVKDAILKFLLSNIVQRTMEKETTRMPVLGAALPEMEGETIPMPLEDEPAA
ncbi:hypothetical protein lerEdw1_009770 [Lerista edwardsae]|nr:hypothetical protein lerEdw1_009770 [Lerista edwardsae]